MTSDRIQAWHFVADTLRDGRPVPADGEVLTHEGPIELCASGLHASRCPFDALRYAPGETLCRVELWGDVAEEDDKLVARNRVILERRDATDMLWRLSRQYALSVIHLWEAPAVVREFLETGNEELRAAARTAAWAAARTAAWAAARTAARDAAWDAARAAARTAAWAAARTAAWAAARTAARDAQRQMMRDAVAELFGPHSA